MAGGTRRAAAARWVGSWTRPSEPAPRASPPTQCGATRLRITADGVTAERGYISQGAITDVNGNPLLLNNTDYSVRVRIARSGGLTAGTLRVNAFSPTAGQIATGIAVAATQLTTAYAEFTADLFAPQPALPADLTLRVYADGIPAPSGESFYVDCIEVFPTNAAQNASLVRASSTEEPESYDGVTGILNIAENNGQGIRAAFTLRNNLYFAKERSLYVTATDGVNEPALWQVAEVSNKVGTPSAHGVGYGEEWVVIAGRSGLYYFDGSEPVKLSQEIQPTWDAINWQYGQRLWVQVDTQHKRILVGVPMGSATQPSQILVLDYTEGLQDPLVAVLTTPERGRKWATWTIAANCCGLIERSTGVAQIFLGSNNSSGKIYSPVEGQYSDDGAAINSFYSTAFLAATGLSGRNLFGYLTAIRARRWVAGAFGDFAWRRLRRLRSARGRWARPPRATWSNSRMCWPSASPIRWAPTPSAPGSHSPSWSPGPSPTPSPSSAARIKFVNCPQARRDRMSGVSRD